MCWQVLTAGSDCSVVVVVLRLDVLRLASKGDVCTVVVSLAHDMGLPYVRCSEVRVRGTRRR